MVDDQTVEFGEAFDGGFDGLWSYLVMEDSISCRLLGLKSWIAGRKPKKNRTSRYDIVMSHSRLKNTAVKTSPEVIKADN